MSETNTREIREFEECDWEKREGGGGRYLYCSDENPVIRMRIVSKPYKFYEVWNKDGKEEQSFRFAVGVIHRTEDGDVVKGFRGGASIYDSLRGLHNNPDWGNVSGYDVTITREGTGMNTKYTVSGNPKSVRDLTEDEKELYMEANINLVEMYAGDEFDPLA